MRTNSLNNKMVNDQATYIAGCLSNYGWKKVEDGRNCVKATRNRVTLYIDLSEKEVELRIWKSYRMNICMVGIKRMDMFREMGAWLKAIDIMSKQLVA